MQNFGLIMPDVPEFLLTIPLVSVRLQSVQQVHTATSCMSKLFMATGLSQSVTTMQDGTAGTVKGVAPRQAYSSYTSAKK
jgi:hypothetical protein